jgi:hypothetical protein
MRAGRGAQGSATVFRPARPDHGPPEPDGRPEGPLAGPFLLRPGRQEMGLAPIFCLCGSLEAV